MYKNRQIQNPTKPGIYPVFGTVNKNTEHETRSQFYAVWDGERFVDQDGEDLIGINESVEFWFDMSLYSDPATAQEPDNTIPGFIPIHVGQHLITVNYEKIFDISKHNDGTTILGMGPDYVYYARESVKEILSLIEANKEWRK